MFVAAIIASLTSDRKDPVFTAVQRCQKLVRFVVIAAAVFHTALWSDASAQGPVIRGVVVEEHSRAPIAAVAVQLRGADGKAITVVTNAQGRFQINAPAAGRYEMRAARIGYFPHASAVLIGEGPLPEIEVRLSPRPVVLDSMLVVGKSEARRLRTGEQLIHGKLIDDDTREPIANGTIELRSNGQRVATTVTDKFGLFRVITPKPAGYTLRAERMGYHTSESPELKMMLGDTVRLDFHLSAKAVLMAPILVTGSARNWAERYNVSGMEELFSRMTRFGKTAVFITRDTLKKYENSGYTTDKLIEWLAPTPRPMGCSGSAIYLNGGLYMSTGPLEDSFSTRSLEAIEVYNSPRIPGEFSTSVVSGFYGPPCRVISLWTRR